MAVQWLISWTDDSIPGLDLGELKTSERTLVMANGARMKSEGTWTGRVGIGGAAAEVDLEVFDSGGAFGVLLGKPFLAAIGALQDFRADLLRLGQNGERVIRNLHGQVGGETSVEWVGTVGEEDEQDREVRKLEAIIQETESTAREEKGEQIVEGRGGAEGIEVSEIGAEGPEAPDSMDTELKEIRREWRTPWQSRMTKAWRAMEQRMDEFPGEDAIQAIYSEPQLGPNTDRFAKERVRVVLAQVSIGADLAQDERKQVENLVAEFADIFAPSLSEVRPVVFIEHKLTIKEGATLPTRVSQKPLTEAQKTWYMGILDDMGAAGICKRIAAEEVRCVSGTTLAPKEEGGGGMTREDIIAKVNEVCRAAGLPAYYVEDNPKNSVETKEPHVKRRQVEVKREVPRKWRVCHSYMTLNKNTQVPPFPQGNLYMKQQRMAGKRWTSVIDFAAGYYAVRMAPESIPYTAFYVEGRGYYAYRRMPFGSTGAPTTFCEMVAKALDDMIGRELECWMDDNEVLFAGAQISPIGVDRNTKKIQQSLTGRVQ
ncbi:hypothetical protein FS837_005380 [Tulasnella sp. UAMH 9824]|nr:hypothetical protein FS837_005380 [Tulasnella sp. UAMH 9824]